MAAGAEEVMVVMPKYTPGHVVLRVEREGGEMALSYAMSGGYFTRLKYRGSETVVDFLFKVLQRSTRSSRELHPKTCKFCTKWRSWTNRNGSTR